MIYPDLDRELNGDPRQQIAEIERKNRQTDAARETVARAVANSRARDGRKTLPHGRKPRTLNARPQQYRPLNPKPRTGRPPADPERLGHWGTALLDYVRRDSEEQREAWRNR